MRGTVYTAVSIGLLAGIHAAGCTADTDPARQRERFATSGSGELVIGAVWPWAARPELLYGEGLELAVEQANAGGGVHGRPLRLRRVDDGGAIEQARLVAQQLADDPSVVAVIGHHQSAVTTAAAGIYDLAGLVLVSATSTSPGLTAQGYRHVFRTVFSDVDVGRGMARFALERGCRGLAVYYSRDGHGRDLANAFEEFAVASGGQVVARASADPGDPSNPLGAERVVASWRQQPIDAVFLATPHKQAAVMAVELRRQGFRGPLFGTDALAAPAFLSAGGDAVEGVVFATAFNHDAPTTEARRFVEAFRERFGHEPDVTAALGYDAVGVLVHAMRKAPSVAPSAVAATLRRIRDYAGVTGVLTFDDSGGLHDPTVNMTIIRDGRPHALTDDDAAPDCTAAAAATER